MSPLLERLKKLVSDKKAIGISDIVIINALKEYLQHAVLDFVYNSPKYSHLIMYGGTLLRICYELPRMSEDLDFQTAQQFDCERFKEDIIKHFKDVHNLGVTVTANSERTAGTDMLVLKFDILKEVGSSTRWSVLKLRFDINMFPNASTFRTEVIPRTKDTFSYAIRTYPLSTLMASKIVAVFNRTIRNIEGHVADCKPRDVYDLMWYMEKKIVPDMIYLKAKGLIFKNELELFQRIVERVEDLADDAFEADLGKFFYYPEEYNEWFRNWRQRFTMLYNDYEILEVISLVWMRFAYDPSTDNRFFHFLFKTEDGKTVKFTFILAEGWYLYAKLPNIKRNHDFESYISEDIKKTMSDADYVYATILYEKVIHFLNEHQNIVLQNSLRSKIIRYTSDRLNSRTEVLVDEQLLLSTRLEDLL